MSIEQKDTYFVAVKVFLEKDGELLILKDNFGDWDLPGGRIKKDEFEAPLEQIIKRKMSEELGDDIKFSIGKPVIFMRHQRVEQIEGNPIVRIFAIGYEGKIENGEIKLSERHPEMLWVDPNTFKPEKYFKGGWLKGIQEYLFKKKTIKDSFRTIIKAIGIFTHDGKVLAAKGRDEKKGEDFYRAIGGSVDFREKSNDAMRREVKEELGCDVENLKLVDVIENVFTFNDEDRHQIVFLYSGELSNKDLYKQGKIRVVEPYSEFDAEWISIEDVLSGRKILYPSLDWSSVLK